MCNIIKFDIKCMQIDQKNPQDFATLIGLKGLELSESVSQRH